MATFEIRQATQSDFAAIRDCTKAAYQPYISRMGAQPGPMLADFATHIEAGEAFVASLSGQTIGVLIMIDKGDHMLLDSVSVRPDHQGKGIGKMLVSYCEAKARGAGHTQVQLYTNVAMTDNLALYPKLGYEEIDRRSERGYRRVYFRKNLSGLSRATAP